MPYDIGTKVQHRNGYIKVKIEGEGGKPKWEAEARRNWELTYGDRDPIVAGDRVFHKDGDRTNDRPSNLAKIHYNDTKFVFLKKSRVLWEPKFKIKKKEIVYHEPVKDFDRRVAVGARSSSR